MHDKRSGRPQRPAENWRPRGAGPAGSRAEKGSARRVDEHPIQAPERKAVGVAPYTVVEARRLEAPAGSSALVDSMLDAIEDHSPLPKGRAKAAGKAVIELWKELTSERSTRSTDYIGEPSKLAAYLRYFLPWNVVRLVPILAGIELRLEDGDSVLDIGSGPLTLPIALWIARPELRRMRLRIVCVDRVRRAMEAGAVTLESLAKKAGSELAWELDLRRESFQAFSGGTGSERHAFVAAANVFNEGFWKRAGSLGERAADLEAALRERAKDDGRILVVEPGDPRSGAMLAALREAALGLGGSVESPCPHGKACPMPGVFMSAAYRQDDDEDGRGGPAPVVSAKGRVKQPWCHFVLPSEAAPERLESFSESVGLPKDRLVASWLLYRPGSSREAESSGPTQQAAKQAPRLRLVSDSFSLADGGRGRYACSAAGYTLAVGALARYPSGTDVLLDRSVRPQQRDPKSGAIVVDARFGAESPIPSPSLAPDAIHGEVGRPNEGGQGTAGAAKTSPAGSRRGGAPGQRAAGPTRGGRLPRVDSPPGKRHESRRGPSDRPVGAAAPAKRSSTSPRAAGPRGDASPSPSGRKGRGPSSKSPRSAGRGPKAPRDRKPPRRST